MTETVRPIDGNRLAELFEGAAEKGAGVLATVYRDAAHFARTAPTIEPEVRHGRLIEGKTFNDSRCSECGQVFRDDIRFIYPADESGIGRLPKRCPECGCYWTGGTDDAGR